MENIFRIDLPRLFFFFGIDIEFPENWIFISFT